MRTHFWAIIWHLACVTYIINALVVWFDNRVYRIFANRIIRLKSGKNNIYRGFVKKKRKKERNRTWLTNNIDFLFYFFCFNNGTAVLINNFFHKRPIDVLDSKNQPGSVKIQSGYESEALGLTEDVWHQKYENKKGFWKLSIFIS